MIKCVLSVFMNGKLEWWTGFWSFKFKCFKLIFWSLMLGVRRLAISFQSSVYIHLLVTYWFTDHCSSFHRQTDSPFTDLLITDSPTYRLLIHRLTDYWLPKHRLTTSLTHQLLTTSHRHTDTPIINSPITNSLKPIVTISSNWIVPNKSNTYDTATENHQNTVPCIMEWHENRLYFQTLRTMQ